MSRVSGTHPQKVTSSERRLHGPHFTIEPQTVSKVPKRSASRVVLSCRALTKSFRKGDVTIPVLRGVNFSARDGEFAAIVGQSGSGKSTLLHLLGTLDNLDSGEIQFEGKRIDKLSSAGKDALRNSQFGMIFQFYHLLPELTTLENVMLPMMIHFGVSRYFRRRRELRAKARELIELVGLSHRLRHRPKELSGGEMQRVAIARALINNPRVLLADEPTGNLDRQTGAQIMRLLRSLNETSKLTIVMVTHDLAIADQADRLTELIEGQVRDFRG